MRNSLMRLTNSYKIKSKIRNHYNVKLLRGYGVSISLKNSGEKHYHKTYDSLGSGITIS